MEQAEQVVRPNSRIVGILTAVSPMLISEVFYDIQHWIRGQSILSAQPVGNVNPATAGAVSAGIGTLLATSGLGMLAPVCNYICREWLMTFDTSPKRGVSQTEQLEKELKRLNAEMTQKMGRVLWNLEPMNKTLEEILRYVKFPALQRSEEKRWYAEESYRQGHVEDAVTALRLAIAPNLNPANFSAHYLLGYILMCDKQSYEEALDCFQKAALYAKKPVLYSNEATPVLIFRAAEYHLWAAASAYRGNRFETALKECEAALQIAPDLLEAYYPKAKSLVKLGKESLAATALRQMVPDRNLEIFQLVRRDPELRNIPQVQNLLRRLDSPIPVIKPVDERGGTLYETWG